MNLDLREIPAIYINLDKDVERNDSIHSVLKDCGFKNIIRISNKVLTEHSKDRLSLINAFGSYWSSVA